MVTVGLTGKGAGWSLLPGTDISSYMCYCVFTCINPSIGRGLK